MSLGGHQMNLFCRCVTFGAAAFAHVIAGLFSSRAIYRLKYGTTTETRRSLYCQLFAALLADCICLGGCGHALGIWAIPVSVVTLFLGSRLCVVGVTGGIGAGKSTLSNWLNEKGVAIVDADIISRNILLPGTCAYYAVVSQFGSSVLQAPTRLPADPSPSERRSGFGIHSLSYLSVLSRHGSSEPRPIDRGALRKLAFSSPSRQRLLTRITHFFIIAEILRQLIMSRWSVKGILTSVRRRTAQREIRGKDDDYKKIDKSFSAKTATAQSVVGRQTSQAMVIDAALLFESRLYWLCAPVILVVTSNEKTRIERVLQRQELASNRKLSADGIKQTNASTLTNRISQRGQDPARCLEKPSCVIEEDNQMTVQDVKRIMSFQKSDAAKAKLADLVLENNGTVEDLLLMADKQLQGLL